MAPQIWAAFAAFFHRALCDVGTDEVSLLQFAEVSAHDFVADPTRTAEQEEFLWTIKLNFTKPCHRDRWFKDGPKIVTDKDVSIWKDKRPGIVADNSVECENFCLQYDTCDCFIYDLARNRCNLKQQCSGRLGKSPAKDFNACMFERPPKFMLCTTGPGGLPCQNGCVPKGLKPDCSCLGPGKLGPTDGYKGKYCEEKDECFEQPAGTACGNGGECKLNSKGLMECSDPCDGSSEGDSCTTGGNAGKCAYGPGGALMCIVDPCAGKGAGAACDLAPGVPGGTCKADGSGKMVCGVECQCATGPGGQPCLNDGVPTGTKPNCKCQCKNGYTGDRCEVPPQCTAGPGNQPCLHGGVATGSKPNCKCQCKNGYTGDRCEIPPACTAGPNGGVCQNGGTASGNKPNCECQCPPGYGGANCETPLPCTTGPQGRPCLNGGTPTGTTGSCECQCINRFSGDWCETDPVFGTIKGNPLVFIIDKSGSMSGRGSGTFSVDGETHTRDSYVNKRLGIVMSGLTNANLPNKTWFNVIYFSSSATRVFAEKNVEATAANIRHAHTTVAAVPPKGSTYAEGALAMAFTMDPGAIYFLTDGLPNNQNTGNRDTSSIILAAVPGWENGRNIPINCIAINAGNKGRDADKAKAFLTSLSDATGGDLSEVV